MAEVGSLAHPPGSKLIIVEIGEQKFAMDIMAVREIRGWTASTPLPHAPDYVHGMINLRGVVLPVVDLGMRLGIATTPPDSSSVVVVVHIADQPVGLRVNTVCDIMTVAENMVQATPAIGAAQVGEFVAGVMTTDAGIITLLSLDLILPQDAIVADAA